MTSRVQLHNGGQTQRGRSSTSVVTSECKIDIPSLVSSGLEVVAEMCQMEIEGRVPPYDVRRWRSGSDDAERRRRRGREAPELAALSGAWWPRMYRHDIRPVAVLLFLISTELTASDIVHDMRHPAGFRFGACSACRLRRRMAASNASYHPR